MSIELGKHEDGYKVRISDSGKLERNEDGEWKRCAARAVCGEPMREAKGLNGQQILVYRMPLAKGKSVILRRVGDDPYFDVDKLQTRLENDLAANRHCIR